VHPEAARGFSAASQAYERGRPSFPHGAVDLVRRKLGAAAGATILDVGAGTGKFTRLLTASGARLIAVEPLAPMRAILHEEVPSVLLVAGVAERLPLRDAAADGIVVAQAFHWFDGERALDEFQRVLRPGGALALVWNARDTTVPWVRQISDLIEERRGRTPSQRDRTWRAALAASDAFADPVEATFPNEQPLTPDTVVDRVLSISFIASLPAPEREQVAQGIRRIVAADPATRGRDRFGLPQRTMVATTYLASATTA
jgi:SAM-dependent methyltransferase